MPLSATNGEGEGGSPPSNDALTKKPRASRACDTCRKKKVKCDNEKPACSNCVAYGYECTYLEKQKKRGPQPSYPKALEDRLERLEAVLTNLAKRDSSLPSEIVEEFRSIEHTLSESNPERCEDSVEEELDKLKLEDPKYFSYVGSSSGVYLFKGGSFYKQGRLQNVHELIGREPYLSPNPLSLDPAFPPPELREGLLTSYFRHINTSLPTFPLGRNDRSLTAGDDTSELLYNCIFTLASFHNTTEGLFRSPEEAFFASRVFQARAKALLDRLIVIPSIGLVQALVLLSLHPQNSWLYLGMAIRIAQELGLHRTLNSHNLDPIERERRKLLWWNCVVLDRGISSFLGRPLAIHESDCNASLPLLPEVLAKEASIDVNELSYSQRAMKCYIVFIRLSQIMARMLREIHTAESTSQGKIKNSLKELNRTLNQWELSLPEEFKYNFEDTKLNDRYTVILNLLHCYCLIVLNRPFIPKTCRKATAIHPSQLICAKAASILTYCGYHYMRNNQHCIQMHNGVMFTACTVHLINSLSEDPELSRISKQNLRAGLEYLNTAGKAYLEVKRSLTLLDDLLKSYKLSGLEEVPVLPTLYNPAHVSFTSSTLGKNIQRHDSESLIIIPTELADHVLSYNNPSNTPSPSMTSIRSPSVASQPAAEPQAAFDKGTPQPRYSYMPYELLAQPVSTPSQSLYPDPGCQETSAAPGMYQSPTSVLTSPQYTSLCSNPVFPLDSQGIGSHSSSLFPNSEMAFYTTPMDSPNQPTEQPGYSAPVMNPLHMDVNFEEWNAYMGQFMK
ncbi:hypothetical protein K493DRAFT_304519 [Basidiobolus meristosporus CBS 931.73]|uniref:Zn(2)-C6 fungal-type domain-containing protein n=1 Tax=Basidiobolus meristosporus CBS 931.73 TaxID=1314790 RepID=A0A1Y1XZV1_9FUNG|nr:hypothetical protein K493DRAFT_304519 [Basidiobolus meristosporus CBS 931.73]|eukprot:ORX90894.1 hypothetical protein K493DRAFT_304519 [Basidiobolus meristosporus CBS 931.73]